VVDRRTAPHTETSHTRLYQYRTRIIAGTGPRVLTKSA
jgi:hypothetical protein